MSVGPPHPHTPGWSGKEQGSKSPRISACAAAAMAPHSAPLRTHHAACQGRMIDEEWATRLRCGSRATAALSAASDRSCFSGR